MTNVSEIQQTVRSYVVKEFLPDADEGELQDSTPLITGGILDSISTLKLVTFLEHTYGVEFEAHELSPDRLDTIASIAATVRSKISGQ
jgi:acyl carrier protein